MTNELDKQFFDTFGIEPKPIYSGSKLYNPFVTGYDYPTITDSILLGLICIWNSACTYTEDCIIPVNYQTAKQYTLNHFIDIENYRFEVEKRIIKHQVRTLFEEG